MGNLTTFQLIVIMIFVIAAIIGAALFSLGVGPTSSEDVGAVEIWGTLPFEQMDSVLAVLREEDHRFVNVTYIQKDPRNYDRQFVDALASGKGPDLFLLPQENFYANRDKILYIPFDTVSERAFKDAFAEIGEIYITPGGIAALPLLIDPLVMYWNRDIFTDASISSPPEYWDELFTMSPRVTQRDQTSNITRSFVAFGEYRNVIHAKDILAALILQTGNPIVFKTETGELRSILTSSLNYSTPPAEAALRFYTEFSNPTKSVYSWNRALPDSRQSFLAGDLALYFGFGSEFSRLGAANPNLNFDVALMPQSRDAGRKITYGQVMSVAIPKWTDNSEGALQTALALASEKRVSALAGSTGLAPARRDVLRALPQNPTLAVFYESAIAAESWIDPDDTATEGIFQRMLEGLLSGKVRLNEAISGAEQEIGQLLSI